MTELLENRKTQRIPLLFTGVLVVQPLLDVLSFFMQQAGLTVVTTWIRMLLLAAVCLLGFYHTDRKGFYAGVYGTAAVFWALHMVAASLAGYQDPVGDGAEFLKLVQLPLWALTFITLFQKSPVLIQRVPGILAVNFGLILCVIALSFFSGNPVYTYDYPERGLQLGVLGWFGVPNAQSAVLAILVPFVLFWVLEEAKKKKRLWLLWAGVAVCFGLLYLTGTRVTYLAGLLVSGMFLVFLLIERRPWHLFFPFALALLFFVCGYAISPMAARQARQGYFLEEYRGKTEAVMGEDMGYRAVPGEEIPPQMLEKIQRVYLEVYGGIGPYGLPLLGDLLDRFGLERVMEAYRYRTEPEVLYDARTKKLKAAALVWEEQSFFTKLVGYEYASLALGENNYDPENDFQPLLYYYGYVGVGLYLAVWALVLWQLLRDFIRRRKRYYRVWIGVLGTALALGLGAALFSGQVLRRPNVTVYLSVALALLVCYTREKTLPLGSESEGKVEDPRK